MHIAVPGDKSAAPFDEFASPCSGGDQGRQVQFDTTHVRYPFGLRKNVPDAPQHLLVAFQQPFHIKIDAPPQRLSFHLTDVVHKLLLFGVFAILHKYFKVMV